MRFPSVAALAGHARDALQRFPWTLSAAAGATAAGLVLVGGGTRENEAGRLMMVAMLALPLTLALSLLAEREGWTGLRKTVMLAAGVLLLAGFFQIWPGPDRKHDAIRYFQLSAGLHLLVAVLPFARTRDRNAFWQYNRRLFEGLLRSAVFSLVLFVGLMVALAAIDRLFGVHIPPKTYGRLGVVLAFMGNTWIFASGIPRLDTPPGDRDYPRALKVFTQYVLTPLVTVYLLIITAYLGKILITGTWPNGWIGYLVASVAVTGVLGFLLVSPLRDDPGERWIRAYTRWLFIGLIPAAIMFLLALWKRADPYGLTELRVLGFLLGGWLLGLALLYTLRRDFGIRVIPASLAVVLLVTLYGPASITGISVRSQADRLETLLRHPAGGAKAAAEPAQREVAAAIRFLVAHGAQDQLRQALRRGVPESDSLLAGRGDLDNGVINRVLAPAGLSYDRLDSAEERYLSLSARQDSSATPITGYDYSAEVSGPGDRMIFAAGDTVRVHSDSEAARVLVTRAAGDSVVLALDSLLPSLPGRERTVSSDSLRIRAAAREMRMMLALSWIRMERRSDSLRGVEWRGTLYWTKGRE